MTRRQLYHVYTTIHLHLNVHGSWMQVQQGKDEVMLEFLPDTAAAEKEDALCEMTFYVPRDNERYAGDEEVPASKVSIPAARQTEWLSVPGACVADAGR